MEEFESDVPTWGTMVPAETAASDSRAKPTLADK
jgi:hypothetical protein